MVEGLGRSLQEANRVTNIQGVNVGRIESLTHLLFVNDVLLFCYGYDREGERYKQILEIYNDVTIMEANVGKSTLFTLNLDDLMIRRWERRFPFQHLDVNKGVKYLGFTLPNSYGKANQYCLLAKIEKHVTFLCNKWLSQDGRLVLIKSMLEAILVYENSLAHIPKGILEKIRKLCFNFWDEVSSRALT